MAGYVTGGRETLAHLRSFDKDLYWKTVNKMKTAAKPLADAVDSNFPSTPPMRGFAHNGRTGWNKPKITKIKVGGRRNRDGWPLVRIFIADAPRMIFDLATGNLGDQLAAHGWGDPSRAVWRTGAKLRDDTTDAVEKVIRDAARETNRKLARVG